MQSVRRRRRRLWRVSSCTSESGLHARHAVHRALRHHRRHSRFMQPRRNFGRRIDDQPTNLRRSSRGRARRIHHRIRLLHQAWLHHRQPLLQHLRRSVDACGLGHGSAGRRHRIHREWQHAELRWQRVQLPRKLRRPARKCVGFRLVRLRHNLADRLDAHHSPLPAPVGGCRFLVAATCTQTYRLHPICDRYAGPIHHRCRNGPSFVLADGVLSRLAAQTSGAYGVGRSPSAAEAPCTPKKKTSMN